MQIGEVARALGVTTRTIRYYESFGLIKPNSTSEAGYRLYTESEVVMLDHVLVLHRLGFSLQDIKRLLDQLGEAKLPESEQARELIRRQLEAIEREIGQLEEVRGTLRQIDFALGLNAGQPLHFVTSVAQAMGWRSGSAPETLPPGCWKKAAS